MKIIKRDPDKGYMDNWLWAPKKWINTEALMSSLSFAFSDSYTGEQKILYLWRDSPHHLGIPRMVWKPGQLTFEVVDCRPQSFLHVPFKSKIKLDHRNAIVDGKNMLTPTGDNVQHLSIAALQAAMGGVLQLACVAGDTIVNLNRGGKGFKTTIAEAFLRSTGRAKGRNWDPSIPTYIRSSVGERIGLQEVLSFIERGTRTTYSLQLADGKTLRLTNDHEVLTPHGYRSLESLDVGDFVIVDGARKASVAKKKRAYRRIGGFVHHPFARYQSRSFAIEEHRVIVEADLNNLTLTDFKERCRRGDVQGLTFVDPAKFHVHHKDENIFNNELSNLEVLSAEAHLSQHRPGYKAFGHGVPEAVRIKSKTLHGEEPVYDVACVGPHHNYIANGVVVHNCGKGKTCIALEHIARNQVPAIVVVDNTNLLYQWEREINALLEVPGGIGYFMGGHDDWRGKGIVLATYHTLGGRADSLPEDFRRYFGAAYYDEGHHASAPLFSRGVSAIYGRRYSLTATPERDDGQHIIADLHIGPVLHKDLRPMMKPQIFFYWTGLELDVTHPDVQRGCYDVNGELHLSKIKSYLGRWRERMWLLLHKVLDATKHKRKVLLLSDSVEEVVNLLAMWTRGPHTQLCSELPFPTLADVNETLEPLTLEDKRAKEIKKNIENIWTLVNKGGVDFKMHGAEVRVTKGSVRLAKLQEYMESWQRYLVYQKLLAEERRRQRVFLKELLDESTTAGVMTFGVDPRTRQRYLDERDVVFAITKYGKEGLDCEMLDTVLVSSIFSSKNGLQQLNGRPTRPKPGKKMPTIVLFVDAIGQMRGMEQKLMRHLRQWPHEEGGPYEFELINYPKVTACKTSTLEEAFGR